MAHQPNTPAQDPFDEPQSSTSLGMLAIGWRHKWLLALGLIVGVVVGTLYCAQLAPEYQSSLKLLVVKKRPDVPLGGADNRLSAVEDYLSTHQVLIRSPLIISEAIRMGNLKTLPSLEKSGSPTADIIRSLTIAREATEGGATNILTLSYRSANPEDCAKVLNFVVDSYKEFLDATYRNVSVDTFKLITQAKEQLENRLTKKEEEYRHFRLNHPVLLKSKDGMTVRQEALFNIEKERSALLLKQVDIEEKLTAFETALRSGQDKEKLALMMSEARIRPKKDSPDPEGMVLPALLLQEQTLLEDFGGDHPQVRAVRKRIQLARADRLHDPDDTQGSDPYQAHLQSLKRDLMKVKTSELALAKVLQMEQSEAQKLITHEIQDETYRKDIAREQQLFESVLKRLQEINLLKDFGGYDARCINPADIGMRIGPKTVPIFVIAVLLGLAGGIGLAYLSEISDQSFRTPEDVRQRLRLPIVGQIPSLPKGSAALPILTTPEAAKLSPILLTYHQPKSNAAEAYRGVRTGLFFSVQGKGHKAIQVTSPNMGDGKSTLAANLAVSIAQADKKVILIDADFRRPTLHKLFGVSATQGLASVLNGEAEVTDVIQPSGIERLSVLPCGPIPTNPAELLSLPRFKELLDYIRDQYDFVIVDSPPLLAVTDPCMVVPHVDGVLLTLRLSKQGRPAAIRAKEILSTLDAKVIGVVVNAVDEAKGSYNYSYGYGAEYYQDKTETAKVSAPEKENAAK